MIFPYIFLSAVIFLKPSFALENAEITAALSLNHFLLFGFFTSAKAGTGI